MVEMLGNVQISKNQKEIQKEVQQEIQKEVQKEVQKEIQKERERGIKFAVVGNSM